MTRSHYYNYEYDNKDRFCSYWHQINEIVILNPDNVLEIGMGNAFVAKYLASREENIITLDIDITLVPNVVGSVLKIPFAEKSFNVVACYEILEHLSYVDFLKALLELHRVSDSYVILSLPDRTGRAYKFNVQIPKLGEIKRHVTLPKLKSRKSPSDGVHLWEIGTGEHSLKRITKDIKDAGFLIMKNYRIFECPYHRFLVLKKQ